MKQKVKNRMNAHAHAQREREREREISASTIDGGESQETKKRNEDRKEIKGHKSLKLILKLIRRGQSFGVGDRK